MKTAFLLGRILFGGFFLQNAVHHFKEHRNYAPYAASKGIPNPEPAIIASGVALAVGGASILLGVKPKVGAASLIGFLAITSVVMHDFWNSNDAADRQNNKINFSKNLALLGAALALAGVEEPWSASLSK